MRTIIKSNYEELPRYVDVILGQRYKQDKNEFLQEESFRSVLLLRYLCTTYVCDQIVGKCKKMAGQTTFRI